MSKKFSFSDDLWRLRWADPALEDMNLEQLMAAPLPPLPARPPRAPPSAPPQRPRPATRHTTPAPRPELTPALMEQIHNRKMMREVQLLISSNTSSVPDFSEGYDDVSVQTRRADKIKWIQSTKLERRPVPQFGHIEYSGDQEKHTYHPRRKIEIINVMAQLIYHTRYKLPVTQLLRTKYNQQVRYQIGYNYAILRNIKRSQYYLYNIMLKYGFDWATPYAMYKLYEKILRLNVDVRDLVRLNYRLDRGRKLLREPDYYHQMTRKPRSKG